MDGGKNIGGVEMGKEGRGREGQRAPFMDSRYAPASRRSTLHKTTYGRRAFSVAGPATWNSLTDSLRDQSLFTDSLRRLLKPFCCQITPCVFRVLEIVCQ